MSNKKHKKIYCCNCGKLGHIYKYCKDPITSFGIISYKLDKDVENLLRKLIENNKMKNFKRFGNVIDKGLENVIDKALNDNIKLLMIRRKDTFGFVEILRGRYELKNSELLLRFFNIMTRNERERVRKCSFDELWNTFWMIDILNDTKNRNKRNQNRKEYNISKEKFNMLKNGIEDRQGKVISIESLITKCSNNFRHPEWGFPKGRKNIKETNKMCAIREFKEETGVDNNEYEILNINPVEEVFIGTNDLRYKHIYYVARHTSGRNIQLDKSSITQMSEISAIKWFNSEDAINILRPYNQEKKRIISVVINKIKNNIINNVLMT